MSLSTQSRNIMGYPAKQIISPHCATMFPWLSTIATALKFVCFPNTPLNASACAPLFAGVALSKAARAVAHAEKQGTTGSAS